MMDTLGTRRVVTLFVLIAICALSGSLLYGYAKPDYASKEMELRRMHSKVSVLQTDIDLILSDFKTLENQKEQFSVISEKGFFKKQGRYEVQELFEILQEDSGVIQVKVSGEGAQIEDSENAAAADHAVLASAVTLIIDALDDRDIYRFIYLLKKRFPGHVSVDGINIVKQLELDDEMLQDIVRGENPALVQGTLDIVWRTMIPKSDVLSSQGGQ